MSNLSVNTITDASGGSTASINGLTPQASNMQPYNMVINGAMTISQRGTSFTGLTDGGAVYTLDRWQWVEGGTPSFVMSVEQSSDAPAGFSNSLKTTTTTGSAIAVSDDCRLFHWMEGNATTHLAWGTATAKPLTVSFWVKSSVTGNYSVGLYFSNSTARLITSTYTINTANTWEYKTITFLGDTGLAPVTDNGAGVLLQFGLIAGTNYTTNDSTSWANYVSTGLIYGQTAQLNTTNDTWQITGVQLEAGSTASSFAHENYSDTLQKCLRYYWRNGASVESKLYYRYGGNGESIDATQAQTNQFFPVPMRAIPSLTTNGVIGWYSGGGIATAAGAFNIDGNSGGKYMCTFVNATFSGLISGRSGSFISNNNTTSFMEWDAEL